MFGKRMMPDEPLAIERDLKDIGPKACAGRDEIGLDRAPKSQQRSKVDARIFEITEMVGDDRPFFGAHEFIRRTEVVDHIRKARLTRHDKRHILLRDRLVDGHAGKRDESTPGDGLQEHNNH